MTEDMPTVDGARAEAERRYGFDSLTVGGAAASRTAFVAGAEWLAPTVAALEAEVERLRAEADRWRTMWDRYGKNDLIEQRDSERARADAAEAVIERVRGVADEWAIGAAIYGDTSNGRIYGKAASAVRAALSDAAPQAVEDRQPYDGPTMRLIEAGHDLSLAPHYPGPGKWCEACPIPQPAPDATDGREGA